jgi:hypothetical protein
MGGWPTFPALSLTHHTVGAPSFPEKPRALCGCEGKGGITITVLPKRLPLSCDSVDDAIGRTETGQDRGLNRSYPLLRKGWGTHSFDEGKKNSRKDGPVASSVIVVPMNFGRVFAQDFSESLLVFLRL